MTPEDEILLLCARQHFSDSHKQRLLELCQATTINWSAFFDLARQHQIAPLVYVNLLKSPLTSAEIPTDLLAQIKADFLISSLLVQQQMTENLRRALQFFHNQTINVMIIKGAALDILVYEQPWYTTSVDIDLVIQPHRDEIPPLDQQRFMDFFHCKAIEYDYFAHHDVTMNGILAIDFQQIWADARLIEVQGQPAWVMAEEDLLISLCINSCRKRFFRLKSLSDIAETIKAYPDLNWATFLQKTRAYQCQPIVYTALLATTMSLGCPLPEGLLASLNISPPRRSLINYLCKKTSFSSLHSGKTVLGRQIDWSILLPYATHRWDQIFRRIKFALKTTPNGLSRWASNR